ncbi:hypothetical protein L1987_72633 [Smallanthus sonchifolius]|uniref:Uncharacterized protein n=1 Tax=Smallanthus sonchifolius TaxID=185202 RepID=A0ACB9AW51_9ASTR|nr:hypothetical protein L1987_72633 [Smallanthus sonchifolius]
MPSQSPSEPHPSDETIYNIIPIQNLRLADHPSLRFPEVRAAAAALRNVNCLRRPPFVPWQRHRDDLLDWLGAYFGFQPHNVSNQREHLVLHLANAQIRLQPPPVNIDTLDHSVLRRFRRKLLSNYTHWCSFLGCKSNISDSCRQISAADHCRELLPFFPSIWGENAFLNRVVKPIYDTVKAEVENSKNGTAPHSNWRNYDDINEYFWSRRCFDKLKWPIDIGSNFFATTSRGKRVGKTGFVEQRSFLNLFRSFEKLWIMLFMFLQAAIIVAWKDNKTYPWQSLEDRNIQAQLLSVFITWSALRLLQAVLDVVMQYKLVSRETMWLGVRMVLKIITSVVWIILFLVFYTRIWSQKSDGQDWSSADNKRVVNFLEAALVFILPEILALVLFIIPWVRNFLENTNWRIFYLITWWFQSKTFVGRGLREGLMDNIKYYLFWIVVLATKFSFSYFLQIKPMIEPTKAILDLNDVRYKWHEFFGNSNRFAVGLLWLPVVLIYLMDLQIWYCIYSSFVGVGVGLLSHLGEIRNVQQQRLRFQFFAGAMQFNLMTEGRSLSLRTLSSKFKDALHRLKLRYGLGRPFKKLESNQIEAHKFALIWNEIILTFREEDIVSDHEVELLELPQNTWNVRVVRWPCILLSNELLLALSQAKELVDAPDQRLWSKIGKHEYRRCSIIETYDSVRHLLLTIVQYNTQEHSIITTFFQEIDNSIDIGKFTKTFNMYALPKIHSHLISLVGLLIKSKKDVNKVINILQALYEVVIRDLFREKRTMNELKEDGLAPRRPLSGAGLLFENAVELPGSENDNFYRQARRLHTILTSRDSMNNVPLNLEARRRIAFFSNSLFMNIPHAPQVEKMMAFSVLTPYYNEEVVYSKEQLRTENEDGVSTLYYLQTIYADEWVNFLQRMRREGMMSEAELWTNKLRDLRLWASYRGQTLARTVRGMMYYYRALKMLAFLDSASEMDIREGAREYGTALIALMKFTYVVACQIYGTQKAKNDPHAEEILYLMKNNEALRVAYVDEVVKPDGTEYYSVLVKYDQKLEKEVEIYRVRLPGPLKLGEGKPENQNHALIFTRGDAVQTIDMNQDNYFEEALKMRNLLEEYKSMYGIRKPNILGVRENIFTGSVSSPARFMSAQESSFVTLGQRVLANPLKIRLHYGHPDVFDRFWFLTRGGISKASRLINLSEDIFAGFNCTLRGGNVTHHEYIQVGKGRDVGLNQISMFEAKVASGNGEQVLSRDVYRLGHRLDFFRMLSFFYTSVGFFFNTMMLSLAVYAFLWGRLYLALSGVENSVAGNTNTNGALRTILNQQFIVQLGLFTVLPMIVENTLEFGFHAAIWDFITMQLQFSSLFYSFSLGTRSHYFGRTILHGGAKYRATGRGFVVEHKKFAENYRLYARSHFIKAIELGLILTVYAGYSPVAKGTFTYIALTISSWFLVVSWIMAPFVFNPSGFDRLKTVYDYDDFMRWIWFRGGVFAKPEQSWERWWYEEQDHLRISGLYGKLLEVILDLRFFFFQYGIVYQMGIAAGSTSIAVYILSWIYVVAALGMYSVIVHARGKYSAREHIYYRLVQILVIALVIVVIISLMVFTEFKFLDIFTSLLAFIPTGWGLLLIAQVFRPVLEETMIWGTVVSVARLYDAMFEIKTLNYDARFDGEMRDE